MLVLIALGVAGVIYAIVQLGIAPLIKSKRAATATIASVQKKLKGATVDIKRANALVDKRQHVRAALRKIDENHIIRAAYDQYRLAATPIIERAAKIAGVRLRQHSAIAGGGQFGVVMGKKDRFKRVFRGFKVQVFGTGGYEDLVEMLRILETENPYISISDVTITRSGHERSHTLNFGMLWPIWQDEDVVKNFAVEEEEEKEEKKPKQG